MSVGPAVDWERFEKIAYAVSLVGSWERKALVLPNEERIWEQKELLEELAACFRELANPLVRKYGRFVDRRADIDRDDLIGHAYIGFREGILRYQPWRIAENDLSDLAGLCAELYAAPQEAPQGPFGVVTTRLSDDTRATLNACGDGWPNKRLGHCLVRDLKGILSQVDLPATDLAEASLTPGTTELLQHRFPAKRIESVVATSGLAEAECWLSKRPWEARLAHDILLRLECAGVGEGLRGNGPWDVFRLNRRLLEDAFSPYLSRLSQHRPALPYVRACMKGEILRAIYDGPDRSVMEALQRLERDEPLDRAFLVGVLRLLGIEDPADLGEGCREEQLLRNSGAGKGLTREERDWLACELRYRYHLGDDVSLDEAGELVGPADPVLEALIAREDREEKRKLTQGQIQEIQRRIGTLLELVAQLVHTQKKVLILRYLVSTSTRLDGSRDPTSFDALYHALGGEMRRPLPGADLGTAAKGVVCGQCDGSTGMCRKDIAAFLASDPSVAPRIQATHSSPEEWVKTTLHSAIRAVLRRAEGEDAGTPAVIAQILAGLRKVIGKRVHGEES